MSAIKRRILAALVVTLIGASPLVVGTQPAPAFPAGDSLFAFNYHIDATTHIKRANQTVTVRGGKFHGLVDLDTGQLTGSISLPRATFTTTQGGIGLVTATEEIVQVKPITGTINLSTFRVKSTSVFNIRIVSMYPASLTSPKVNLVGRNCHTSSPVSVTMSGIAHIGAPSTFKGVFTIPPFQDCSTMTTALNQMIPGPGNTFVATAKP
jgi:hypothetical protein